MNKDTEEGNLIRKLNKDGGPKYRCVVIIASQKMTPRPSLLRTRTAYAYAYWPKYRCVVIIASQKMIPRLSLLRTRTAYAYAYAYAYASWKKDTEKEEKEKKKNKVHVCWAFAAMKNKKVNKGIE